MSKVLIIDGWRSTCGECGRGCDPDAKSHDTVLEYGSNNSQKGCGAVWDEVASASIGGGLEEAVKKMRPDLKYIGLYLPKPQPKPTNRKK